MSDLRVYIEDRKKDHEFSEKFEQGYQEFKLGAMLRQAREEAGLTQEELEIPTAIRLSADVVEYFKSTGAGWQSRIDAALRDWMAGHPLKRV